MYVTGLRCFRCGAVEPPDTPALLCPRCGFADGLDPGILDVEYDLASAGAALRAALAGGRRDEFRWLPLLPLDEPPDVPFTGGTPLVEVPRLAARYGLARLWLKDESRNPTRCLKDRATAVFVGRAQLAGRRDVYCASAGNAAISLAGFSAHAGLDCHVFVPSYASPTRLAWLRHYGADVHVSRGDYDTAFAESETAAAAHGWYSRNCAYNPYLVEGKKTAGLEIAEQLEWTPPDLVVAPVGDGCTLAALGKAFRELRTLGLIDRLPRLVGVQASELQPLVRRFRGRGGGATDGSHPPEAHHGSEAPQDSGDTRAASIRVRTPRNALRLLAELGEAGGDMVAVTDEAMAAAQRTLGREAGLVAELTSAAGLAALDALDPAMRAGRTAVVLITGGRPDEL